MIQFILLQAQGMAERDIIKNAGNQNIIKNGIKIKKQPRSLQNHYNYGIIAEVGGWHTIDELKKSYGQILPEKILEIIE